MQAGEYSILRTWNKHTYFELQMLDMTDVSSLCRDKRNCDANGEKECACGMTKSLALGCQDPYAIQLNCSYRCSNPSGTRLHGVGKCVWAVRLYILLVRFCSRHDIASNQSTKLMGSPQYRVGSQT